MDSLGDAHGKELVEAITSDWIEARFKELAHLDLSPPTKANRWQCWKIFFEYLDVNGLIEKPKNLKTWKFSHDAKEIKSPWTVEEYQAALQVASGAKRLCLLLAANCSFYASDICASFQHFDAKTGTIRMSRIKTQKKCKPVVYYLWAETTESMKNHGKELERMYNIIKKWRFPTPMKQLRHTTKSFLMNSAYSQFTAYMTGEKGGSINEQWYWTKEHNPIKKAVCFLHSCYFPKTTGEP
jgi:hypothetical protein